MSSVYIPPPVRARLKNASHRQVADRMLKIKEHIMSGTWLPPDHPYRSISNIENDARNKKLDHDKYLDYVCASAPIHAIDGWRCLSSALGAMVNGDFHGARHMAYYAELRAVLSILASQGIGVTGSWHYLIKSNGECVRIDRDDDKDEGWGTHRASWTAFKAWLEGSQVAPAFGKVISVGGQPLTNILQTYQWQTQIPQWLLLWGVDVQMFSDDRDARNVSSYEPSEIDEAIISWRETYEFLEQLWSTLNTGGSNLYEQIDRHLIRIAFLERIEDRFDPEEYDREEEDKAKAQHIENSATRFFRNLPDAVQRSLGPDFLSRKSEKEDIYILKNARLASGRTANPIGMICRSLLMLRMASGMNRQMLSSAGIDLKDSWLKRVGQRLGITDIIESESALDLVMEVYSYLTEDPIKNSISRHEAMRVGGTGLCFAQQAERIGIVSFL